MIEAPRVLFSPQSSSKGPVSVAIENGRIAKGIGDQSPRVILPAHSVLLPGLINAHTHLDLTAIGPLPRPREHGFLEWVRQLVPRRAQLDPDRQRASVRTGVEMSLRAGTTSVGDIDSFGVAAEVLESAGLGGVVYRELLGLNPDHVRSSMESAASWLADEGHDSRMRRGLTPHAPYSTSPELYRWAVGKGRPIATHGAETLDEIEFLTRGEGGFVDLVSALRPSPQDTPPGLSPIPYLESLGLLGAAGTVVHANYLEDADIERLARSESPVVYCPRSHDYFGHRDHPVRRLLDAGVHVGLGTDSLASNETLSLFDEMRFLRRERPDLHVQEILTMATVGGASALGFDDVGTITHGFRADVIAVSAATSPPSDHQDLLEWLSTEELAPSMVMVEGRLLALDESAVEVSQESEKRPSWLALTSP